MSVSGELDSPTLPGNGSGRTFTKPWQNSLVYDFCLPRVRSVRTAVLYEKPWSTVNCDWVWRRTDLWINFPWSTEPPIVTDEQARS